MAEKKALAEALLERIDIVKFIGRYVALQPAGQNFKAICPFHSERTPSFHVNPSRRIWHCFGDGSGGDVITFLEKIERISRDEAIARLATDEGL